MDKKGETGTQSGGEEEKRHVGNEAWIAGERQQKRSGLGGRKLTQRGVHVKASVTNENVVTVERRQGRRGGVLLPIPGEIAFSSLQKKQREQTDKKKKNLKSNEQWWGKKLKRRAGRSWGGV